MRKISILLLFCLASNVAIADNFFNNTNPFPTQISTPQLNNVYGTEQTVIQQEKKTEKKMFNWRKRQEQQLKDSGITSDDASVNEGIKDSGFYIFK